MKKLLTTILACAMTALLFAGCGEAKSPISEQPDATEVPQSTQQPAAESTAQPVETETPAKFALEYPKDMQELGFTEPVVMDSAPKRVVCLSAAPVLALYEMGVNLVGVPRSAVVTWPKELAENSATVAFSAMSPADFDYESVVNLEPDLVILGSSSADTAGAKLVELGITVYYVSSGHVVSYESIKMQTEALIRAFGVSSSAKSAGEAITQRFAALETSLDSARAAFAGKSVMVLQSADADTHYIQTSHGTLGSMLDMLGFSNVFENKGSPMVQLNYEDALDYNPDYVVCVGGTDADSHRAIMQSAFDGKPEYWNAIPAIERGDVVVVGVTYVSSAGINVIDNISNLIAIMSEASGIAVR